METRLFTPTVLNERGAFDFIASLPDHEGKSLVLDFSQTQYAYPLGSLILAAEYRTFVNTRKIAVRVEGIDLYQAAHGYLAHMGFFKSLGIPIGKRPGQAEGTSTYVPITVLTLGDLEKTYKAKLLAQNDDPPIGSIVEGESMRLSKLITQDLRPRINRPIAYCFREVIRNVFEHAAVDRCAVYGQRWSNGFIEVAIVDRGRGIRESLQTRYKPENDLDALSIAITPGVSAAAVAGDGEWANSGFGLFVLSELGKELGAFTLCSGQNTLMTSNGTITNKTHPASFNGTAVAIKIRQLNSNKFKALIDAIVDRGEASVRARGEVVRASKSSRLSSERPED